MSPILTVCIPLFNGEKTIISTIKTIINTNIDLNIVVINDHSSDKGPQLVKDINASNVHLIENVGEKGPGIARNLGIEYAKTKYITFCDADDQVTEIGYKSMLAIAMANDSDFVVGQYLRKIDNSKWMPSSIVLNKYISDSHNHVNDLELMHITPNCWSKLFKTEFLKKNKIRFNNAYIAEDLEFVTKCQKFAKKINMSPEVVYLYKTITKKTSLISEITPERIQSALQSLNSTIENLRLRNFETLNYVINHSFRFIFNKSRGAGVINGPLIFKHLVKFIKKIKNEVNPFIFYSVTGIDIEKFTSMHHVDSYIISSKVGDINKIISSFENIISEREFKSNYQDILDCYLRLLERTHQWMKICQLTNKKELSEESAWICRFYFMKSLFNVQRYEQSLGVCKELIQNNELIFDHEVWLYYAKALLRIGKLDECYKILAAHPIDSQEYWKYLNVISEALREKESFRLSWGHLQKSENEIINDIKIDTDLLI